jgi:hypothetical protein
MWLIGRGFEISGSDDKTNGNGKKRKKGEGKGKMTTRP